MPIVLKSGSLNLLEPSGPVQACNGIALPLQCVPFLADLRTVSRVLQWLYSTGEWSINESPYNLCIFIVMSMYSYYMFMYLHLANWHSSATLTEVFPVLFSQF